MVVIQYKNRALFFPTVTFLVCVCLFISVDLPAQGSSAATNDESSTPVGETVKVAMFSLGVIDGWEERTFKGSTQYQLEDDKDRGTVLGATSNGTASVIGKRVQVDLTRTPYINWSWKIDNRLQGINEETKRGDDFVARIYLVRTQGVFGRRSKAINYVWSSNNAQGRNWSNPYRPGNSKMIAVRGIEHSPGQWVAEKRNVLDDFFQLYGERITRVDLVGIMTDTDNSGRSAGASYGDIYFSQR